MFTKHLFQQIKENYKQFAFVPITSDCTGCVTSLNFPEDVSYFPQAVVVAQSVRAFALHAEGRVFEFQPMSYKQSVTAPLLYARQQL